MRDADVRQALLHKLLADYAGDRTTRIVQEMGIWAGSVRIDVAVINGHLHGFELKSAKDTLERLDDQAELYSQVFDGVTLVAADRHLGGALDKIPIWWGVIVAAELRDGTVRLHQHRAAQKNPAINPLQVARLLWRSELLDVLTRHHLDRGVRSGTVEAMAARLSHGLPFDTLFAEVREALKARTGWLG